MKENRLHLIIVTTEYTAASTVEALLEKESSSAGMNDWTAKTRSQSMGASYPAISVCVGLRRKQDLEYFVC